MSVLERPVYSEAEAARLLDLSQSTLHYWLEGGTRGSRTYRPVLRMEPKGGHPAVTWAEFVEAGLLSRYRNVHKVPMPQLRGFIDTMREALNTPYPLAHEQPFVAGRALILRAQEAVNLDPDFCLVADIRGQYVLLTAAEDFYRRVTWTDQLPTLWRPDPDENSPVRINPDLRFGRPNVAGISTEVLWEHHAAGETDEEIAEEFGLAPDQVRWGISYELTVQQPAA